MIKPTVHSFNVTQEELELFGFTRLILPQPSGTIRFPFTDMDANPITFKWTELDEIERMTYTNSNWYCHETAFQWGAIEDFLKFKVIDNPMLMYDNKASGKSTNTYVKVVSVVAKRLEYAKKFFGGQNSAGFEEEWDAAHDEEYKISNGANPYVWLIYTQPLSTEDYCALKPTSSLLNIYFS
jgi:hypothetical protein